MPKKNKRIKKHYTILLPSVSAVVFLLLLFFIFWQGGAVPKHDIYVSSQNPKQGETILIKINGKYSGLSGYFDNEKLNFFRNGEYSDWSALLGIDATHQPGKYKILVSVLGEKMEKKILVLSGDFSSVKMAITKELKDKGYTGEKIISNIKNNDNPALNEVLAKFTPKANFNSPFSFPLENMRKSGLDFGEFVSTGNNQIQHFGVDLGAVTGTEVHAANDGKIVLAKNLSNYGKTIIIDHGLGIFSMYLHLDAFMASLNQDVKKAQVIGLSGNSGLSTAPHLHFSIRDNGTRIDPLLFIKTSEKTGENFNLASIANSLLKILK